MSPDDRRRILERRARFVALALATLSGASACENEPAVCLELPSDAGIDAIDAPLDAPEDASDGSV